MKNKAIRNLYSNVVSISNEKDCWDADGNSVEIDEKKVAAELKKLETEYEKKAYQRKRKLEYPTENECIHALLDGGDALNKLQEKRQEIKLKYPK